MMKGQSSIELIMVIGMAMVLASPFILTSQDAVLDLQTGSKLLRVESSLDKIESGVNFVSKYSAPTKTTFRVDIPSSVVDVRSKQFADRSAIIFNVQQRGEMTNRSRIFDRRVVLQNASELEGEGKPKVAVQLWKDQINVSVVG
ncbi:hypothetical protein GKQ38_03890 [Candidatus Nanohaloarchaea archaeon]|nr:hypothetical protein GKQ38_03890 [Candidatus Nanohaloarchaea archaeon]